MAKQSKKAPEKLTLNSTPRTELGKKVRQLRKQGKIPANIFGQDFKSKAITLDYKDFIQTYRVARETGLIYISLENDSVPTIIFHVQKDPIRDTILHIDFRKVDLKQKIETAVPIQITGTSEAVSVLGGVLLTQSDHLMVEALPADIPPHIELDISALKEIGQEIKVSDIRKSETYEIKEEPNKVIVSITAHKEESIVPETTVEAPEITTEKAEEGEAVEGAKGAPGEAAAPAAEAAPEKQEEKK